MRHLDANGIKPESDSFLAGLCRYTLFERALCLNANFDNLETEDKLRFIMQHKDLQFTLGNTVYKIFQMRKMFV